MTELPDAGNRNLNHFVARNEARSSGWLFVELPGSGGIPYNNQQVNAMTSHQYDSDLVPVPDDNFLGAMVVDANLPSNAQGQPAYLDVWTRMLGELVYRSDFE